MLHRMFCFPVVGFSIWQRVIHSFSVGCSPTRFRCNLLSVHDAASMELLLFTGAVGTYDVQESLSLKGWEQLNSLANSMIGEK
jgi:hypothetical protein